MTIQNEDESGKKKSNNNGENNVSTTCLGGVGRKSIIFMDVVDTKNEEVKNMQDRSFSESIKEDEEHYKREEIYSKSLYHDLNQINNANGGLANNNPANNNIKIQNVDSNYFNECYKPTYNIGAKGVKSLKPHGKW